MRANTPTVMHTDTLARPFYTMQYLSPITDVTPEVIEQYVNLDIQGNRLSVKVVGRNLVPLQYKYNMLQAPCYQLSIDSGVGRILLDVAGQPIYNWDADNRRFKITYDALRRPLKKEVLEGSTNPVLEVYVYGEGQTNDKLRNLRGQPYQVYDGAGLTTMNTYDFKGNPLSQTRVYTEDGTLRPDWTSIGTVSLETADYETLITYDALNRVPAMTAPDGAITRHIYDKGGLLFSVAVEDVHSLDTGIVNAIRYDAKGQRQSIQYGNGTTITTTTTYEYDPETFRVKKIRTTRHSDSAVLQELDYWYDPVGNITLQKDGAHQPVYFNGSIANPENNYTYDALYRLIQAGGREHAGNNNAPDYNDGSRTGITPIPVASTDTGKMRTYIQYYEYDETGNFKQMRHTVTGGTGNWTRYYTTEATNNRLKQTVVGSGTAEIYLYDTRGNITGGFAHLQSMLYNAENRLERVVMDSSRTAYYQYDSSGQRVRKTIINTSASQKEVRKYVGEWEVYSKFTGSSLNLERETLHVSDDSGRVALIDTRTTGTGTEPAQLLRYQYSDHLSTATLELDATGAIISYEEYYPYGSTSFQSGTSAAEVSLKRYRYTGKERDEESGLYYHGARYYVPWLCRWCAVDPLESERAGLSPYDYCSNNPMNRIDEDGMQDQKNEESWHPPLMAPPDESQKSQTLSDNPMDPFSNVQVAEQEIHASIEEVTITAPGIKRIPKGNAMGEIMKPIPTFDINKILHPPTTRNPLLPFLGSEDSGNAPANSSPKSPATTYPVGAITDDDLNELANSIGIKDVRILKAIESQESKKSPFYKTGQATILYERHIMYEILDNKGADVDKLSKKYPKLVNSSQGGYGLFKEQYTKLAEAKKIDESAAIQSASWGRFQVLGRWYANRYSSPQEMERAMNTSEKEQLLYFGAYLKNTPGLIGALNNHNWELVARLYNGKGWRKINPEYANNLRKYFNSSK